MIEFRVYGLPKPKGSKRGFTNKKTGAVIMVESAGNALKEWEEAVKTAGEALGIKSSASPFSVYVEFIMPRTKAMGDNEAPHMVQRPDIEKLARGTFDPLSKIIWDDDSQIVSLALVKRRADPNEPTGAIIRAEELTEYPRWTNMGVKRIPYKESGQ